MRKKPVVMVFPITYKCNCRCVMCTIWKNKTATELSLNKIQELFSEKILSNSLRAINISGGEPTLRSDLPEIIKIVSSKCTNLESIGISTNGINTDLLIKQIDKIFTILPETINLNISISFDGIGETHDKVRNIQNAFKSVTMTIYEIKKCLIRYPKMDCSINMTISSYNYDQMEDVYNFACDNNIGIGFTPAIECDVYINSKDCDTNYSLTPIQKVYVADSFDKLYKIRSDPYYQMAAEMLHGKIRSLKCIFQNEGFVLDVDGNVYTCGISKDLLMGNIYLNSFAEIWFSPQADAIRKEVIKKCMNCPSNCYVGLGNKNQLICYLKKQGKKYIPMNIQREIRKLI